MRTSGDEQDDRTTIVHRKFNPSFHSKNYSQRSRKKFLHVVRRIGICEPNLNSPTTPIKIHWHHPYSIPYATMQIKKMKPKGTQARYSRLMTVILGLGLVQVFVFMPMEKGLVDMASEGRQTFLIMEPEEALIAGTRDSYFRSTDIAKSLSNEINFEIDTTDLTLLYLHVGKTGGMSLDRILKSNCKWRKGKPPQNKVLQRAFGG